MSRALSLVFPVLPLVALVAACSSGALDATSKPNDSADTWTSQDDPANLLPGSTTTLSDVISSADVGQTFGVDDGHVPYPDTYWPFTSEGTDAQWNGTDATPIEKFMTLTDPTQTAAAKAWEHNNHGSAVPGVQGWWGHCPGWTGAAMSNAPLQHAVNAQSDGQGGVAACDEGSAGCTKFEIGDINALEAESWVDGASNFLGARCDTAPSDIKRDANGRIVRDATGCRGVNAGALLVILANRMKIAQLPMAIDAQGDFNTDQIWNQPAYRYQVYGYTPLSKSDAVAAVAGSTTVADPNDYTWDETAQGFAKVDIGIKWVSEHGPNLTPYAGTDSTREMRFVAVIELDGDPAAPGTKVIGGEYLDDSNASADRLTVPPFVWISTDSGSDDLSTDDTTGHNPYVKPSLVKQLVALGAQ